MTFSQVISGYYSWSFQESHFDVVVEMKHEVTKAFGLSRYHPAK